MGVGNVKSRLVAASQWKGRLRQYKKDTQDNTSISPQYLILKLGCRVYGLFHFVNNILCLKYFGRKILNIC